MRSTLQLLALGFIAAVAARSPPKELRIGVTNKVECDRPSKAGDKISMHYTGKLWETLEKFDSSLDRNQPFEFRLGQGEVVKGFDVGMTNMCIGEKRKLQIPPELAYGERGAGGAIPPNAALIFEVELLDILNLKDEL